MLIKLNYYLVATDILRISGKIGTSWAISVSLHTYNRYDYFVIYIWHSGIRFTPTCLNIKQTWMMSMKKLSKQTVYWDKYESEAQAFLSKYWLKHHVQMGGRFNSCKCFKYYQGPGFWWYLFCAKYLIQNQLQH